MNRFWSKVDKTGECWDWQASRDKLGYGQFWLEGKMQKAHRVAFELTFGPVPGTSILVHSCGRKSCVNPTHLQVTKRIRPWAVEGWTNRGEKNPRAKLTEQEALEIKRSPLAAQKTAEAYGVPRGVVYKIRSGQRWKHLEGLT